MPLSSLQVAVVNHLVAKELSGDKLSTDAFCERMGITREAIRQWRGLKYKCGSCDHTGIAVTIPDTCKCGGKNVEDGPNNAEFLRVYLSTLKEARESTDLYALRTRQFALEQLNALYETAKTTTEKRQVLKDILQQTEGVRSSVTVTDYSMLPTETLAEIALARDITVEDVTAERLAELAKGAV